MLGSLRRLEPVSTLLSEALMRRIGTTTLYHVLAILYYVVPNRTRIIAKQDTVIIVTLYVTVAMGKPCENPGGGRGGGGTAIYGLPVYRYVPL